MIMRLGTTTGQFVEGGLIAGGTAGLVTGIRSGSVLRATGAAAGSTIAALAPLTGPAAPFVAAAGAVISLFSSMFHGCGQTCVQATQYANQASDELNKLKSDYFSLPVHYRSAQQAYLAAFDQVTEALRQACGNPALGAAGQRCISERLVRGGSAPWCPTKTGCDWITTLRDPIANDPNVVDDPSVGSDITAAISSFTSGIGISPAALLGLALIGLGLVM